MRLLAVALASLCSAASTTVAVVVYGAVEHNPILASAFSFGGAAGAIACVVMAAITTAAAAVIEGMLASSGGRRGGRMWAAVDLAYTAASAALVANAARDVVCLLALAGVDRLWALFSLTPREFLALRAAFGVVVAITSTSMRRAGR